MSVPAKKFALDTTGNKWLGVCAGIANYINVDVTFVRVGVAIATFMTFPIGLIAYVAAGLLAPKAPFVGRM